MERTTIRELNEAVTGELRPMIGIKSSKTWPRII